VSPHLWSCKVIQPPICVSIHRDSDNYFWQICALGQLIFFYEIAIAREGLLKNNSRGQSINQGSTETNQQQLTDITQKIPNAHEQHTFPNNLNNLKWIRVIRKSKQFLPIAIHLCVSIIKSGRTLIRWRAKDLKQPQNNCHLGAVNQLMISVVEYFSNFKSAWKAHGIS
jgi:hypothetical protein